jgi:hypothetical protein
MPNHVMNSQQITLMTIFISNVIMLFNMLALVESFLRKQQS